ncbi:MAG TPA: hypothetical protein VKA43_13015 [Gammaproteobacteria bacterium]|nr:hypothetical protein [Gammaproteobacteria bacterium]
MSEVEQRRERLPSAPTRQASGAATRGDGAGRDARGRATQGAVADEDAARAAKVRRSAWLLAGLAAFFYLGYIAWNLLRAPLGG